MFCKATEYNLTGNLCSVLMGFDVAAELRWAWFEHVLVAACFPKDINVDFKFREYLYGRNKCQETHKRKRETVCEREKNDERDSEKTQGKR